MFGENVALLVIDMQNDFLPGGALSVANSPTIIPGIIRLIEQARAAGSKVVFTVDAHTKDNISFASNHEGATPFSVIDLDYGPQVLWPDH